jgi:uncharacterized protein (DUF433 family)
VPPRKSSRPRRHVFRDPPGRRKEVPAQGRREILADLVKTTPGEASATCQRARRFGEPEGEREREEIARSCSWTFPSVYLCYADFMIDWSSCPAVERDPARVSGAWVFRGSRVPIAALFQNLEDGAQLSQFIDWFPGVTLEQVRAVLDHAARSALAHA